MPRFPRIDQEQDIRGPAQQARASERTYTLDTRESINASRAAGAGAEAVNRAQQEAFQAQQKAYSGGEAAAQAGARAALASGEIGDAIAKIADPLEKRWKQQDLSNQQVAASRTHMQWANRALEKIRTGDPGDPDLVGGFLEEFDQNTQDMEAGAQTEEGRLYLRERLASMRAGFGTQVLSGQAQRAGDLQVQQTKELVANQETVTRANPAMLPQVLKDFEQDARLKAGMFNLLPEKREELLIYGRKRIVAATIAGLSETNPELVKQQFALDPDKRNELFKSMAPGLDSAMESTAFREADHELKYRDQMAKQAAKEARVEQRMNQASFASSVAALIGDGDPLKARELLHSAEGKALPGHMQMAMQASIDRAQKGIINGGNPTEYLRWMDKITPPVNGAPYTPVDPHAIIAAALAPPKPGEPQISHSEVDRLLAHVNQVASARGRDAAMLEHQMLLSTKHALTIGLPGDDPNVRNILADYAMKQIAQRLEEGKKAGLAQSDMVREWDAPGKRNPNYVADLTNYERAKSDPGLSVFARMHPGATMEDYVKSKASGVKPPPASLTPLPTEIWKRARSVVVAMTAEETAAALAEKRPPKKVTNVRRPVE